MNSTIFYPIKLYDYMLEVDLDEWLDGVDMGMVEILEEAFEYFEKKELFEKIYKEILKNEEADNEQE